MKSRKWIILVSIALLSVCAAIALCQFQELRINVIELEIPDPPGSKVTTALYRDHELLPAYLLWDKQYEIPTSAFESVDSIKAYFHDWLTKHDWVETDDELKVDRCTFNSRMTQEDLEGSLLTVYITRKGLNGQPLSTLPQACLAIDPTPQDSFYHVRLITLQESLWAELNE